MESTREGGIGGAGWRRENEGQTASRRRLRRPQSANTGRTGAAAASMASIRSMDERT
jgi:hypothetical protein